MAWCYVRIARIRSAPRLCGKEDAMASRHSVPAALASVLALLLAAPAAAQTDEPRGFVVGHGGASLTESTSPIFGGAVGVNLSRHIQITGEVGRMQNVFPTFTRTDLLVAVSDAAAEGIRFDATSRMPTVYGMAGIRVLGPGTRYVRPYVLASGGVAHLTPKPTFKIEGLDVTDLTLKEVPEIRNVFRNENRPMASVGGGFSITVVRHVAFDMGYKYSEIFITKDYLQAEDSPHQHHRIDVHRFYFGAGYAF
jgi:opacity protein-like surface antigen